MSNGSPLDSSHQSLQDDYREAYRHHAATLRNWYVGFGVGAPVVFLSNEYLWQKVVSSNKFVSISWIFFMGVAFQVLLAFFDKYANWVLYYELARKSHKTKTLRIALWWMNNDFLSIFLDIGSLVLFGLATFLALSVVRS